MSITAILLGLPGKVQTLLGRLTATRAGYLDRLDATVASRAAASTALSTAQWSNALATGLANIATKGLLVPPKAGGLSATVQVPLRWAIDFYIQPGGTASQSSSLFESSFAPVSTSYADALNYTGSGYLAFVAAHGAIANDASTGTTQIKITLDGVEVLAEVSANAKCIICPIGSVDRQMSLDENNATEMVLSASPMLVPFAASCKIEAKYGTQPGGKVLWKLIKTS